VIALDTNLLIYAHRSRVPEHRAAQAAIEEACNSSTGCGIAWPCITEFYSIVTHPASDGRASTAAEAAAFIRTLQKSGGVEIFTSGPTVCARLLQTAIDLRIAGARIFDLQIALISLDGGATELWTHDAKFVRVPGLRVKDPLA
jgi:hypothetical protein